MACALTRLEIVSLKILENEEEEMKLLSGSVKSVIINSKLTIPMHTALIFKEQSQIKNLECKEMV
jgi:hypothetical protein